jgi:hypothetical protein
VLSSFAKKLNGDLEKKGCTLLLMSSAVSQMNGNLNYYGGNPLDLEVPFAVSSIIPAYMPKNLSAGVDGSDEIANPPDMPYESTNTVLAAIKTESAGKINTILPFIQYFGGYEQDGAREQIRALSENDIKCYILYDEGGIY